MSEKTRALVFPSFLLLMVGIIAVITGFHFRQLHQLEPVILGPGVTRQGMLSDYHPDLVGLPSDTPFFHLDSGVGGGRMVILGGVHPNEIAGVLAAVIVLENAVVEQGELIMVPRSNASGFTHNAPSQAVPSYIEIDTPWGARTFRYGDRLVNPLHQYPDPDAHVHYPSGSVGHGSESRNLNRNFPGRTDGTVTEQVAWAITQLVNVNDTDLLLDMHEARPMNPIVDAVIAHERAREVASFAILDMQMIDGVRMRLEPSPVGFRGLSHREIGDATNAQSVLAETPNVAMDYLRGPTSARLVLDGLDDFMARAASQRGLVYAEYDPEAGLPIDVRIGRHLTVITRLIGAFTELNPDKPLVVSGIPSYADIIKNGAGFYLRQPD